MWPWEHAAFGYLLYSLYRHLWRGESPRDGAAIVAVVAALTPDLVDKPLSWEFGLFPTGYAVGHSVLAWAVLGAAVVALRRHDSRNLGTAAVIGYGSHLFGDVLYPLLLGEGLAFGRILWPLVTFAPYEDQLGLTARTLRYLTRYVDMALDGALGAALVVELAFLLLVLALWMVDGSPGVRWPGGFGSPARTEEPPRGQE